MSKIEVGAIVEGKVVKIKPFGAIVILENNVQGLVHISQISTSYVQNIDEHLNIGDIVKVKVLSVDIENHKISLSIREALALEKPMPAQRKQYQDHKEPRYQQNNEESFQPRFSESSASYGQGAGSSLEEKLKDWLKQSNERQAGLNKRNNRR